MAMLNEWRGIELPPEQLTSAKHFRRAQAKLFHVRSQMMDWQNALLYYLALKIDGPARAILEIGTADGYSAALMAQACQSATVTTINPDAAQARRTEPLFRKFSNVRQIIAASADYLDRAADGQDLIYIDGDHKHCAADLPYFNRLAVGGLLLFHDYDPQRCPPVFNAVNSLSLKLRRPLDIVAMDNDGRGMAGIYRQRGEGY